MPHLRDFLYSNISRAQVRNSALKNTFFLVFEGHDTLMKCLKGIAEACWIQEPLRMSAPVYHDTLTLRTKRHSLGHV